MNRNTIVGIGLCIVGLAGYVAGVYFAYPGRAFSVTAVMVGLTVVAIAQQSTDGRGV